MSDSKSSKDDKNGQPWADVVKRGKGERAVSTRGGQVAKAGMLRNTQVTNEPAKKSQTAWEATPSRPVEAQDTTALSRMTVIGRVKHQNNPKTQKQKDGGEDPQAQPIPASETLPASSPVETTPSEACRAASIVSATSESSSSKVTGGCEKSGLFVQDDVSPNLTELEAGVVSLKSKLGIEGDISAAFFERFGKEVTAKSMSPEIRALISNDWTLWLLCNGGLPWTTSRCPELTTRFVIAAFCAVELFTYSDLIRFMSTSFMKEIGMGWAILIHTWATFSPEKNFPSLSTLIAHVNNSFRYGWDMKCLYDEFRACHDQLDDIFDCYENEYCPSLEEPAQRPEPEQREPEDCASQKPKKTEEPSRDSLPAGTNGNVSSAPAQKTGKKRQAKSPANLTSGAKVIPQDPNDLLGGREGSSSRGYMLISVGGGDSVLRPASTRVADLVRMTGVKGYDKARSVVAAYYGENAVRDLADKTTYDLGMEGQEVVKGDSGQPFTRERVFVFIKEYALSCLAYSHTKVDAIAEALRALFGEAISHEKSRTSGARRAGSSAASASSIPPGTPPASPGPPSFLSGNLSFGPAMSPSTRSSSSDPRVEWNLLGEKMFGSSARSPFHAFNQVALGDRVGLDSLKTRAEVSFWEIRNASTDSDIWNRWASHQRSFPHLDAKGCRIELSDTSFLKAFVGELRELGEDGAAILARLAQKGKTLPSPQQQPQMPSIQFSGSMSASEPGACPRLTTPPAQGSIFNLRIPTSLSSTTSASPLGTGWHGISEVRGASKASGSVQGLGSTELGDERRGAISLGSLSTSPSERFVPAQPGSLSLGQPLGMSVNLPPILGANIALSQALVSNDTAAHGPSAPSAPLPFSTSLRAESPAVTMSGSTSEASQRAIAGQAPSFPSFNISGRAGDSSAKGGKEPGPASGQFFQLDMSGLMQKIPAAPAPGPSLPATQPAPAQGQNSSLADDPAKTQVFKPFALTFTSNK